MVEIHIDQNTQPHTDLPAYIS